MNEGAASNSNSDSSAPTLPQAGDGRAWTGRKLAAVYDSDPGTVKFLTCELRTVGVDAFGACNTKELREILETKNVDFLVTDRIAANGSFGADGTPVVLSLTTIALAALGGRFRREIHGLFEEAWKSCRRATHGRAS